MANESDTGFGALLTTREASARMRVSVDYLVKLALKGASRSVKLGTAPGRCGGRRLFPAVEIDAWVARNLRAE